MMGDRDGPSNFDLYKIALETRNKEISLFWQRSNYFLALNTAAAVGFFLKAGEQYQFWIGCFGAFISVLWIAINLGGKFWQSRWEGRLHKAEEQLNADLEHPVDFFSADWETMKSDVRESIGFSRHGRIRRIFDWLVLLKPSVSFMMILLSVAFLSLWIVLTYLSASPN